jgi:hypothetical protein
MSIYPNVALAAKLNCADSAQSRRFFERRQYLAGALRDREARPIVLQGAEARLGRLGLFSAFYAFGEEGLIPKKGIIQVSSALDLTGGVCTSVKGIPSLNPESIRRFGKSKKLQMDVLRPILGEAVPESIFIPRPDLPGVLDAISEIHASSVTVKPDFDPDKKVKPLTGSKRDVSMQLPDYLRTFPENRAVLVQEFIEEVRLPLQTSLEFPTNERERLEASNGAYNEIRMYFADGQLVVPYGRSDTNGVDQWVFPNPASLPERAVELGRKVAETLQREAGTEDSHIAVDITPDGERIIEVNTRDIGVILPSKVRPLQQRAHELITASQANKLVTMAHRAKGGNEL